MFTVCALFPSFWKIGFVVAVELGNVAKVKNYLETADVDINRWVYMYDLYLDRKEFTDEAITREMKWSTAIR